jgi:ribosomal protein S18 acetylase RimI-like enzyme
MSDITYIRATKNDTPEVMAGLRCYIDEFWGPQPAALMEELRLNHEAYFPKALENQDCIFWLARDANRFAGIGGLLVRTQPGTVKNPSGKVGYIMGMYTMPEYRRRGICHAILDRLESSAAALGIGMLELHASKDGEPAYVSHGFGKHHEPSYRKFKDQFWPKHETA